MRAYVSIAAQAYEASRALRGQLAELLRDATRLREEASKVFVRAESVKRELDPDGKPAWKEPAKKKAC